MSVAVVITGLESICAAIFSVKSLAPPTCPLNKLMTFRPRSSITITAGSTNLLFKCGAIIRTAIPVAQIKISASNFVKISSTKIFIRSKSRPLTKIFPPIQAEIFSASSRPFSVTAKIAILIFTQLFENKSVK